MGTIIDRFSGGIQLDVDGGRRMREWLEGDNHSPGTRREQEPDADGRLGRR